MLHRSVGNLIKDFLFRSQLYCTYSNIPCKFYMGLFIMAQVYLSLGTYLVPCDLADQGKVYIFFCLGIQLMFDYTGNRLSVLWLYYIFVLLRQGTWSSDSQPYSWLRDLAYLLSIYIMDSKEEKKERRQSYFARSVLYINQGAFTINAQSWLST